jgi:large repetitive protein
VAGILAVVVVLAGFLSISVSVAPSAFAASYRSFTPVRYQTNDNGAIELIGNHNQTCLPGANTGGTIPPLPATTPTTCAQLLASNSVGHNQTLPTQTITGPPVSTVNAYIQLDADNGVLPTTAAAQTTLNSSRADLNLPAGSTVLFAGLYWSGSAANNDPNKDKVKLLGPGDTAYVQQTATVTDIDNPGAAGATGIYYQSFKDITSLVQTKGNGSYWVGDVASTVSSNTYAGWSMVVVLQNSIYPVRNLSVFDGFGKVSTASTADSTLDIPIGPFLTPPGGTVNASVGFVAWEGDATITGDKALFKNGTAPAGTPNSSFTTLADATSTANDFFNSSITKNGVNISSRFPNDVNNLGVDIDQLAIPGLLPNGATNATIRLTTAGDTILPGVVTFAVDLYTPSFPTITKTAVDLNGGTTVPGDIVEYSVTMTNTGLDPAINTQFTDVIPPNTTYVTGSLSSPSGVVVGTYNAGTNTITANVGTGATSTLGGTMNPNESFTIKFRVTVGSAAAGTVVHNQARLDYTAKTINKPFSFKTNITDTPVEDVANISILKGATASPVNAGDPLVYTLTVANAGPNAASSTVVTDKLPAGVTFVSATPASANCTFAAPTVTCALGTLPVGAGPIITISTTADATLASGSTLSNTATISSATLDQSPGDNSSAVSTSIVTKADVQVTKTVSPTAPVPGSAVTYTITVNNAGPSIARTVQLSDTLPAGFTATGMSPSAGTCTLATKSCALGDIAVGVGAAVAVTVTGSFVASATGSVTNSATASSATPDGVPGNNTGSVSSTLAPSADIKVTKAASPTIAVAGAPLTYTITVENLGPSVAKSVNLTETLPSGFTATSISSTAGSCGLSGACTLGDLAVGTTTITVVGTVNASYSGSTLLNSVAASSTTSDPNSANNSANLTTTVNQSADLELVKSSTVGSFTVGQPVTYTLTVTNHGPSDAQTVSISDPVPAGVTFTTYPGCTLTTIATVLTVTCAPGTLASGASQAFTLTGSVSSSVTSITNTATVTSTTPDPGVYPNAATVTNTVTTQADIKLTKTAAPNPVVAGSTVTYQLVVTNDGPSPATVVTVSDAFPAGIVPTTFPAACSFDNPSNTITCTYATLAAGASQTISIVAAVSPTLAAGPVGNTATAASQTPSDPTPSNNSATFVSTVTRSADLGVTKTPATQSIVAGNNATWTVSVTNAGPSSADGTLAMDTLPAGMAFVSASGPGVTCTETGGVISCPLGTLAPGAPAVVVTVVAKIAASTPSGSTLTNNVSVSSATPDPTPATSSANVTTTASADLVTTKTITPSSVQAGGTATWNVVVTNNGPSDAQTVSVTDSIPSGFTATGLSSTVGTCVLGTATCTIGTLAAGSSVTIQVTGTIAASYAGTTMANSATASSPTLDPTMGDRIGTAVATVTKLADLRVSKSASADPVVAGDPITYTITLSNAGPSTATSVVLNDVIPSDVTGAVTTSPGCAITAGTLTCSYASLAPGVPKVITISGLVSSNATPGTLSNTASVSSATPETTPADNNSTVAVTVTGRADLVIDKAADTTPAFVGDVFNWTIGVGNNGPSAARNVVVTDMLPSAMLSTTAVATTTAGSCSISGATITCALGTIAAGDVVAIKVKAKIDPSVAAGTLANTASVVSTTPHPTTSNNASTATVPLERVANLRLTKTATPTPVRAGNTINWTITVVNDGPSTADTTDVTDNVPAGVAGAVFSPSQGTCSSGVCHLGTVQPGATATVTVVASVLPGFTASTLSNTASVRSATPDSTLANNDATSSTPVVQEADLAVAKSVTPTALIAGSAATYRLDVTNAGPSTASSAVAKDVLPAGLSYGSAIPSVGGPCTYDTTSREISCPLGSVAPGATPFVTINVIVDPLQTTGSAISNTGTVGSTTTDPSPSNNSSTLSSPVTASANLSISKSASPSPFIPGQTGTYTITVSNTGPSAATAVQVGDPVPAGFIVTGASSTAGTCTAGTTVSCVLGTVPPLTTVTVTVTGNIAPGQTSSLSNTASVTSATPDPSPLDHSSTVVTPVAPSADIRIVKTVDRSSVRAGEPLTYSLVVTNDGPSTAVAVSVVEAPPAGITITGVTTPVGSCLPSGTGRTCQLGDVAPGASVTITVTATVDAAQAAGTLTNSASATSPSTPDPATSNNTATVPVIVSVAADVAVSKTVTPSVLVAGQPVTYTIDVSNNGPSTATGVVLSDPMPTGITATAVTATAMTGTGCLLGGTVTCDIGTLAPGGTVTVTITGSVSAAATAGTSINTASVNATSADPVAGNNSSSATGNLTSAADLSLTKTGTPDPVIAGNAVSYQLSVHNAGPSNATGAVVTDTVPAGMVPTSATWPSGTCSIVGRSVSCPVGAVANGATVVVTINATVSSAMPAGPASNTASVTSSTPDSAPSNSSDTFVSTVNRSANLVASKSVSSPTVVAGNTVTYQIGVVNTGPSTAEVAQLVDTIPAGMTIVSVTPTGGTCDTSGNTITCDAGTLGVLSSLAAVVVVRVDAAQAAGTLTNTVTASSATPDPTPVNTASVPVAVTVASDLKVTKTPSTATLRAGDPLSFTISVMNLGPSDAQSVVATDTLPAGFTVTSITSSLGSCTDAVCSIATLAAGSTATIVVTGNVDSSVTASPMTNTVAVTTATTDPVTTNNTAGAPVVVTTAADLRLSKSASPASVVAGQTITWTINVVNDGPSDALAATVTDVLPSGIADAVISSSVGGCTALPCSLGTIVSGGTASITITATVSADYAATTLDNAASVTSTTPDSNTTNNAASVSTAVVTKADISMVKTGPATIVAGTAVSWTLTVSNAGPSVARNVTVGDPVPEEVNGVTALTTAGTCAGQVSCSLGDLAPGTSVTITVSGTVASGAVGPLTNTATVASPTPDPDETDRTSTVTTSVTASADVRVTKTVTPNPVRAGEAATWTVSVSNLGPSDAQGVTLAETLPTSVPSATLTPSQGSCSGLSCSFGAIAAGTTVTVNVVGVADATTAAGPITNSATASSSTPDPTPSNDTGSVTSNVVRAADLSIVKSATPEPVRAGEPVTYTFAVTNAGPSSAESVVASDPIPSGVSFATLPAGCTQVATTVSCTATVVNVGETVFFNLIGTFDPTLALGSTVNNSATVTSATPDPNTGNNSSTVASTVDTAADLSVVKTVSPDPLVPGVAATYTIVVTNNGPSTARAASVTDDVPASFNTTLVSTTVGTCIGLTSVSCSLGDLAAGASATVTINGTVDPDTTSAMTNSASAASSTLDPSPSNNSSAITTPVAPLADIVVTKDILTSPVVAGQPVQFRIRVKNNGVSTAAAVQVSDTTTTPLVLSAVSSTVGSCTGTVAVTCVLGALAPGVEAQIFVTTDLPSSASGTISNGASATTTTSQSSTTNDSDSVTAPVVRQVNLDIAKSVSPDPVPVGNTVTYTIVVHNNGPSDGLNVIASDTFITGLTPTAQDNGGCSLTATAPYALTCLWPTLANGGTQTIHVTTDVSPTLLASGITNSASTRQQADPVSSEKTATVTANVLTNADLSLIKTVSPATAHAGDPVAYTLTVHNAGPAQAITPVVIDDLPAGIVPTSGAAFVVPSLGSCVVSGQNVTCTMTGNAAVGSDTVITIPAVVSPTLAAGSIPNEATVSSITTDPTTSNNTGRAPLLVTRSADLKVTKTPTPATAVAGQNAAWDIQVDNLGPSSAEAVSINDALPVGMHFVSAAVTFSSGLTGTLSCANNNDFVTCNLGTLAPTGQVIVHLVASVDSDQQGPVTNSATVSSSTPDPVSNNNTNGVPVAIQTAADLGLVKTVDKATAKAGESVVYTLTLTNYGPSDAASLAISDVLSGSLDFGTPTASVGSCAISVVALSCSVPTLANGGSMTVQIPATIRSTTAPGPLGNSASVSSATTEVTGPGAHANTGATSTTVSAESSLSITKAAVGGPFVAGGLATWTVTVKNDGPSAAQNVQVTDTPPAFVTSPSAISTMATCVGLTCTLTSPLDAGDTATITVSGTIPADYLGTDITNSATVTSPTNPTTPPPATVTTPVVTSADLSIVKSSTPNSVIAGQTISWTITVSNAGPSDAQAVQVADSLPGNVSITNVTTQQGTCSGSLSCDIGLIPAGTSRTVTITGTVDSDTSATSVGNTATVSSPTPDPDTGDHTGSVSTPLTTLALLGLTKVANSPTIVPGQSISWTINVSNTGPSTARFVELGDTLPNGLTGTAFVPSQGTCDAGGTCLLGDITVGSTVTIEVSAVVKANVTAARLDNSVGAQSTTPHGLDPSATASTPVTPRADLHITKRGAPNPVVAGEDITWTIDVRNDGPSDAAAVVVQDDLPTSLVMTSQDSCTGPTSNPGVSTYSCPVGVLAAGAATSFTLVSRVPSASLLSAATNSANVATSTADPDMTDNATSAQVRVTTSANLSVVKTISTVPVIAGSPVSWNIAVTNGGSSVARGVQISDVLPAGITNVVAAPDQGTCTVTATLSCDMTDVAAGTTVNVVVTADVLSSYVAGTITNTATASSTTPDPTPDNTDSVTAPATMSANISVAKAGPATIVAGNDINWTITVNNAGPSDAQNVTMDDVLPAGVRFVSASSTLGGCVGSLHCELSTLAANTSAIITVNGTVGANFLGSSISNQATISSSTPDPSSADHVASRLTTVSTSADLRVTKAATPSPATPGSPITWVVTVHNNGPSTARAVDLTDTLPVGLHAVTWSAGQGTCNGAGLCNLGDLRPGEDAVVTVAATVDANVTTTLSNTASVASTTPLTNTTDDSITLNTPVASNADVSVTKTGPGGAVIPGAAVSWNIVVSNAGPSVAHSVVVTDILPASLNLASVTLTAPCTVTSGTMSCALGSMNPNTSVTLTVSGTILASATDPILSNIATVSSPDDSTPGNNSSEARNPTSPDPDLVVTVTPSATSAIAGQALGFTITVKNQGISDAANSVLTFVVPAGYTLASVNGCVVAGGIATCNLGTLTPGQTSTFTLVGLVGAAYLGGSLDLTARATTTTGETYTTNNAATGTVATSGSASLSLTKTANVTNATFGDIVTYTIALSNAGPSVAPNATIIDDLPAALDVQAATAPGATCTTELHRVVCVSNSLAVGDAVIATITAKVVATGTLTNNATGSATVSGTVNQPTANAVVTVPAAARLRVTKTVNTAKARINDVVTYTITVSNDGPDAAIGVVVDEPMAAALELQSAATDTGTFDTPAKKWMVGTLANGQTSTLTVLAKIASVGPITNTVTATGADILGAQSTVTANATVEAGLATPSKLPVSGADSMRLLLIAAVVFVLGLVMVGADRRRRRYRSTHV